LKKVFLGGTCANSKWRDKLIPMLKINYFNPVVSNWNEEARKQEICERENDDYVLYVLTRTYSTYSIAEVVDDSNKRPNKTICCIFNEELSNGKLAMSKQDLKHLDQVGKLVERNGAKYFKSLEEVAEYLNKGVR
jgi:hypothetical protein